MCHLQPESLKEERGGRSLWIRGLSGPRENFLDGELHAVEPLEVVYVVEDLSVA